MSVWLHNYKNHGHGSLVFWWATWQLIPREPYLMKLLADSEYVLSKPHPSIKLAAESCLGAARPRGLYSGLGS